MHMMIKSLILVGIIAIIAIFIQRTYFNDNPIAGENMQSGIEFLENNKNAEGVQITDSGLQYLVLNEGSGDTHPGPTDKVKVHYHGTLIDGSVFDSSVDRGQPIEFGLNQVISGWTEGLQLMVVGEKTRLFIPSDLAYGDRGAGPIPPGSALIFDVELLGINE
jgi:peptidylprolyl isomerase